jgi:hypothetical protein
MIESFCLEAQPGTLVGPIDLTKITPETLPTILQRICDEIQQLKTSFALAEKKREQDYAKILAAIEDSKVQNNKAVADFSLDADNLKTFMKICKFGIAHPMITAAILIISFAVIDFAARFLYWDIWPK